jgi:hypothetical protein
MSDHGYDEDFEEYSNEGFEVRVAATPQLNDRTALALHCCSIAEVALLTHVAASAALPDRAITSWRHLSSSQIMKSSCKHSSMLRPLLVYQLMLGLA